MNVTTSTFSITQMILAWTLLVLLLTWLITFTVLALHSFVMKKDEWENLPTPSRPLPAIVTYSTQPANPQLQYVGVAFTPTHTLTGTATGEILPEGTNAETSSDVGTTPII